MPAEEPSYKGEVLSGGEPDAAEKRDMQTELERIRLQVARAYRAFDEWLRGSVEAGGVLPQPFPRDDDPEADDIASPELDAAASMLEEATKDMLCVTERMFESARRQGDDIDRALAALKAKVDADLGLRAARE